ncbi:MAG TPA: peptidylprolyl isomerase [Candidatus Borkfalkia excrementigallinarum]|uniref:Peptidylprolyl isomerase n=1 Tax=Candidatus Borkfalkia excrementigallinarum TaxID=2838506 RepID=A0A9D1ZV98_9FIRM|nr:peptidylprolyl isomerase [Candidatus Borkfalkia excrementigallinarum]
MAKTFIGKACKLFSVIIAAVLLAGCAFMFAACESRHPEITFTISFNDETYTIEYKLDRSVAPQTVAHYIELIDLDYFDNTVIHDYQSDRMVGGGYTYMVDDQIDMNLPVMDLTPLDYEGITTDGNGNVTLQNISLWRDAECTQPLNRLFGEISSGNGVSMGNGSFLSNSFGALGTYTYAYKMTGEEGMKDFVYITPSESGASNARQYYRNSVQGMFYIYTSTSSSSDGNFCVFGELKNEDSETALQDLRDAISTYQEDEELDSFTEVKTDSVVYDNMVGNGSYTLYDDDRFDVPQCRIIIEKVEVTKY